MTEGIPRRQSAPESAPRTYPRSLPIVPVRARDLTIEGAYGRRYRCLSGAPLNLPDLATPVEDDFVTELKRTLPPGLAEDAHVRFCGPSATEAFETAASRVRAATGRADIVALTGADHGMPPDVSRTAGETGRPPDAGPPSPQDHRCPFGITGPDAADLAARWTEATLSSSSEATSPAGMLLEPIHGECGVNPAPDAWTRATRQITAARSIPLIVDERQTGVGRTSGFWALSEAIGGSLPLAAVIHRDALALGHPIAPAGPFRGNQLALAADTATLAHVRQHRLAERVATIGSRMLSQLRAALELAAAVKRECLQRGLLIGHARRHPSVVRLLPPLTISNEQASAAVDRLADALTEAARAHPDDGDRPCHCHNWVGATCQTDAPPAEPLPSPLSQNAPLTQPHHAPRLAQPCSQAPPACPAREHHPARPAREHHRARPPEPDRPHEEAP
ncbi:diaminobutyrate--2-oxoglutarate aminotransferase [Streptomyces spinoverrucosus]|uniref:Diaminobutyrate--2-oxoglutarate transaminase n=1 Tax=Streptomyces spinoverrucosus TaxID=284043 RepID=A0A4Y3VQQ8_9ACTN|nr:diaminobutyrate--2-oxoglutarate aminotransferase [Streptomyces spinoverrucosus]GHB83812.1 diaminobutyrate--2-oxoglutarate aminotransferase [Streptomyces spinoverrucosus]